MKTKKLTVAFILAQLVLYILILTLEGKALRLSEFGSIALCLLFTLIVKGKTKYLLPLAMAFTLSADFCLVICSPVRRLEGMLFFLCVQAVYAFILHGQIKKKALIWCRGCISVLAVAICLFVLGKNTDALAMVSLCYYANLLFNLGMAFASFKKNALFAIGLLLFLLCDTVIGLQVASGGYLDIARGTLIYGIINAPVNLAWTFYLPSQVLLALSDKGKR